MTAKVLFLRNESDIVGRIRKGDRKALVDLFDRNRKQIVTLVTRNGGSAADAEDVLQESVVVFWEKVRDGGYEEQAAVGTFLYGIARRLWLQRLGRRRRESPAEIDPDGMVSDDPAPDELMIDAEAVRRVEGAMARMDRVCRSLLVLFYWENLTMDEIAKALGFANAKTAKAKKYQCKEKLRLLMQEKEDG